MPEIRSRRMRGERRPHISPGGPTLRGRRRWGSERLLPWTEDASTVPLSSSRRGIGPAERRAARQLGASLSGPGHQHDLVLPDGSRWDVKYLRSPSDNFRLAGAGYSSGQSFVARCQGISSQLRAAGRLFPPMTSEAVRAFLEDYEPAVRRGNVSRRTIFGDSGLLNAALSASAFRAAAGPRRIELVVRVDGGPTMAPARAQWTLTEQMADVLGMSRREAAAASLADPVFDVDRCEEEVCEAWDEAADVESMLSVAGVSGIIVSTEEGMLMVSADEANDAFEFAGTASGGRILLRLRRAP